MKIYVLVNAVAIQMLLISAQKSSLCNNNLIGNGLYKVYTPFEWIIKNQLIKLRAIQKVYREKKTVV